MIHALTLYQPWAYAVASGQKIVENRPWKPWAKFIGQSIAIHAGKTFDVDGETFLLKHGVRLDDPRARATGAILGIARITGYVEKGQLHDDPTLHDPMFFGPFGWKLDPAAMILFHAPISCRGALGLWALPSDVEPFVTGAVVAHDSARLRNLQR